MRPLYLLALSLGALALGCVPPVIQRTALVPDAYLPSRVGGPLDDGEWRLAAEASGAPGENPQTQVEYGSGVVLPRLHLGASGYRGFSLGSDANVLEVGFQAHYANSHWASANAKGTAAYQSESGTAMLWGGAGIRFAHLFASGAYLGVGVQGDLALINQTVYVNRSYSGSDQELFLLPALFGEAGYRVSDWFSLHGLASAQLHVRNTGSVAGLNTYFDSTLGLYPLLALGAGAELRADRFFADATVALPLSTEPSIQFGPTATLALGVRFR